MKQAKKKQECEQVLNSGEFMFREHLSLEMAGATSCAYDSKDFKAKCQEKCNQESKIYIANTEYTPELKTSSIAGYVTCKFDPKTIISFWGACYCY